MIPFSEYYKIGKRLFTRAMCETGSSWNGMEEKVFCLMFAHHHWLNQDPLEKLEENPK